MKKKIISIVSVIVAAVLILVLIAYIGSFKFGTRSSEDGIPELKERKGTITVWWPGSTNEMKVINQAVADYTALYPDVNINVIGQQDTDFYKSYTLACAGNSAPDLAYIDHVYVQALAFDSYIANMSSAGYEDLEDTFIPSLWSPGFYEGKLYGLPMSANVLVTAYNKTLIAKVQGTTTDDIKLPKTYEEYKEICKKIYGLNDSSTKNDPYYGLTIPASTSNGSMEAMTYLAYIYRCGGKGILTEDLQTSLLYEDASYDVAQKIYELGEYCPTSFAEATFEKGRIGFIEMGPWKISDYEKYAATYGWEVGYTNAISFTQDGTPSSTIGLYDLVVTNKQNKANNMALAADFAKFVTTTDKYQIEYATNNKLMPTTKTGVKNEYYSGEDWQVFIKQLEYGVARPGSPEWPTIQRKLGNFVTSLVQHSIDFDDIDLECYSYHDQVQKLLNELYGK